MVLMPGVRPVARPRLPAALEISATAGADEVHTACRFRFWVVTVLPSVKVPRGRELLGGAANHRRAWPG